MVSCFPAAGRFGTEVCVANGANGGTGGLAVTRKGRTIVLKDPTPPAPAVAVLPVMAAAGPPQAVYAAPQPGLVYAYGLPPPTQYPAPAAPPAVAFAPVPYHDTSAASAKAGGYPPGKGGYPRK